MVVGLCAFFSIPRVYRIDKCMSIRYTHSVLSTLTTQERLQVPG